MCPCRSPKKRQLAAEQEAEVDFGIVARRGAASYQAAGWGQAGETLVPGGGAYVFENDVDSAFPRDAADFIANLLGFVINDVVGAEIAGFGELFVRARRRDYAGTEKFGDLDGGDADAAARAEDENIFPGL